MVNHVDGLFSHQKRPFIWRICQGDNRPLMIVFSQFAWQFY